MIWSCSQLIRLLRIIFWNHPSNAIYTVPQPVIARFKSKGPHMRNHVSWYITVFNYVLVWPIHDLLPGQTAVQILIPPDFFRKGSVSSGSARSSKRRLLRMLHFFALDESAWVPSRFLCCVCRWLVGLNQLCLPSVRAAQYWKFLRDQTATRSKMLALTHLSRLNDSLVTIDHHYPSTHIWELVRNHKQKHCEHLEVATGPWIPTHPREGLAGGSHLFTTRGFSHAASSIINIH